MLYVLDTLAFSAAAIVAGATVASSVAPQWRRILRLAAGIQDEQFAPLTQLVVAERRIAVRRWAAAGQPSSAMTQRWREAA